MKSYPDGQTNVNAISLSQRNLIEKKYSCLRNKVLMCNVGNSSHCGNVTPTDVFGMKKTSFCIHCIKNPSDVDWMLF